MTQLDIKTNPISNEFGTQLHTIEVKENVFQKRTNTQNTSSDTSSSDDDDGVELFQPAVPVVDLEQK